MFWKIDRLSRDGVRSRAFDDAMKLARSRAFHSHSRFCRKPNGSGNASLFRVVSIWKILTPESLMTLPMRQFDECSSDLWRSMNEREFRIVFTLWWLFRLW